MRLHIIGICGTFMGSLALLARELGHEVSGSDANVYPPMSTQLAEAGITLMEGYQAANLSGSIDLVVVGNALSRGNPEVEALLNSGMRYTSGAQWLACVTCWHSHSGGRVAQKKKNASFINPLCLLITLSTSNRARKEI